MHDHHHPLRLRSLPAGHAGIATGFGDIGLDLLVRLAFAAPDRGHFGTHQATIDEVQVEHAHAGIVAGALEVAIQQM